MGEDRLPKFFHFDALSQPVEVASFSVFRTAFKLLSGVLYLLPLQVNNFYITFFYAQITCVVSVSSPDPDQYSRLPSKAEPKAKSLSGSCLWGNVILESRTGRPGNNWRKDQGSGESHSWSHQWAGRFQSWNILWSYMKHVKTNTERGMKLGFLYTSRQVQSEGMSDSLSLNMVELSTEPVIVAVAGIKGEAK